MDNAMRSLSGKAKVKFLKKQIDVLQSMFGVKLNDLDSLLDTNSKSFSIESEKEIVRTLLNVLPIAESSYRTHQSDRAAYALNALVSQIRELLNDIDARRESGNLAVTISMEIIRPVMMGITQNVIDNLHNLKRSLEPHLIQQSQIPVNTLVQNTAMNMGFYLEEAYKAIEGGLVKKING